MVGNALCARPALGWLGRLAATRFGAERGTVDLKRHGLIPIVDLARVYALKGGHAAVNTVERLRAAMQAGELGADEAHNLIESFEFIGALRLAHQARQIDAGIPPDNLLAVATLSGFDRVQLREAMRVIGRVQALLRQRHLQ
jgi:CBS domain-containing protein